LTLACRRLFLPGRFFDQIRRVAGGNNFAQHSVTRRFGTFIPGVERLIEYEARINKVLKTHPMTTLCQYDTRKFSGGMIYELLNVHPVMIVHGQIMRNPFYVAPVENSGAQQQTR
jgi:hypothetical protein